MTFDKWMESKVPAYHKTDDNEVLRMLREAWRVARDAAYAEAMVSVSHEVAKEREACAKVCREIAILRLDIGMEPGCCAQVADMCNVAILKRSNV